MIHAGKFRVVALAAVALAVAGCQGIGGPGAPGGPVAVGPAPTSPFEGDWISTDGVAISRFQSGVFETLATDTGNRLATGSYSQTAPGTVSISVTSLIRQTTTQVNCAAATQTQLNCTSSTGQQFSLLRRGAGMS